MHDALARSLSLIALVVAGCGAGQRGSAGDAGARDPHSYSRPDRVAVKHLSLDLNVEFAQRSLAGTVALTVIRHDRAASEVIVDSNGLAITAVEECSSRRPLVFSLGAPHKLLGRALTIKLGHEDCVRIAYRTSADASALLWVDPEGTSGKRQPMLFTQSQAIFARTWIPLQDSPSVRFTYDATIRVPPGLWALMSAQNAQVLAPDGVWKLNMELPIPSYLMALAVGDFAFRPIGERTGVYAEPSLVDAAANEFAEVDAMMTAAERIYGPYQWGRYDMLVLPPSFPFGGMENPRLTFLTPTVITGDRALVSLIAHELAHSWSGNLVTNATWNDFWLNEGFTTYVERRVMEELRGPDYAEMLWSLGGKDLDKTIADAGANDRSTRLVLDYNRDHDPDEIGSDVAYEKGALFLRTLERAVGRARFDEFLRSRFTRLAFRSTDSKVFEREARGLVTGGGSMTSAQLASWLHDPGLPPGAARAHSPRIRELEVAANSSTSMPPRDAPTLDWVAFIRALPPSVPSARVAALDAHAHLTSTSNAEISMYWLPVLIRADVRSATSEIERFLLRVGRRRMVMPVYEAMIAKSEYWRTIAAGVFARAKRLYHPITRDSIAKLLANK
jgi:leukotriene-A4 hydrolase